MANAYRDENSVPVLLATSVADGKTPVRVYADPVTHRLLVDATAGASIISSGETEPSSTPDGIGYIYIDTATKNAYIAVGTSSSADWRIIASFS